MALILKKTFQINLAAVAILTLICALIALITSKEDREYTNATQIAQAKVIEYHPNNHNTVIYEFFVNGRRYSGGAPRNGRDGEIAYDVGFTYPVRYNPADPSVSYLGNTYHSHDLTILWIIWSFLSGVCVLNCCLGFPKAHA